MITSRSFLSLLTASAAGFVLDPELALWTPGKKTIFLPSESAFAPIDWLVKEELRILARNLRHTGYFNRYYDQQFQSTRIGDTVRVALPQGFQ